jgi:hypothetical protein
VRAPNSVTIISRKQIKSKYRRLQPAGIRSYRIDEGFEVCLNIISRREEQILRFLSQERRLEEMVDRAFVYGSFPYAPALLGYWEGQMLQKHLRCLIQKGLVSEMDGGYVRA